MDVSSNNNELVGTVEEEETQDEEEVEAWGKSTAKQLLRNDIIVGEVNESMDPNTVYLMRPEYGKYALKNFKTNLKNLIQAVKKDIQRMQKDCEDYGHDIARLREIRANDPPRLSWHQSVAQKLLKKDMERGKHKTMDPEELYLERAAYQMFDLEVFRKAIYSATDKEAKLKFRMNKKKFRAPPVAPLAPFATLPPAFGSAPKSKKKGRIHKQK